MRGMPVELCVELAAIDGIAEIMTGTVSHKSDEIGIRSLYGGTHIIKDRANAVHNLKVGPFGIAADIIGLPPPCRARVLSEWRRSDLRHATSHGYWIPSRTQARSYGLGHSVSPAE